MLTNTELALCAAFIGVLGTALGGIIGWATNRSTTREQRRLEADRRRDDRRASLYQDMLVEADRVVRDQQRRLAVGPRPAGDPDEAAELERSRWKARAALFASEEVSGLWADWLDVLVSQWHILTKPDARGQEAQLLRDREFKLDAARGALVQQMRRELDSWQP